MLSKVISSIKSVLGTAIPIIVVLGAVALGLRLLKEAPPTLAGETRVVSYSSVVSAQLALGTAIVIPSYFPDYLVWPPKSVLAQKKPFPSALLTVASQSAGDDTLWIYQSRSLREEPLIALPRHAVIYQTAEATLNAVEGEMVIGKSAKGTPLNQLSWREGDLRHVVLATLPPEELLKIARSMTPP